jgi:hypothetical protein
MRSKGIIITTTAIIAMLITGSCDGYMDQFSLDRLSDEVEIQPSLAAPVAYGNFSIQDILETLTDSAGLVSQTEDSLIYLYYSDTAYSLSAADLITIPDHFTSETYIQADINVLAWNTLPVGSQHTFHKQELLEFSIEPEDRIDSIMVKAGSMNLEAYSEFKHSGELQVTSSNIIDPNGDSLDITFTISDTAGTFMSNTSYDMTGYKLTMDEISGNAVAVLNFNLTLVKSSQPVLLGEEAGLLFEFTELEYDAVYGFIAERNITSLNESIELGIFDQIDQIPDIYFADPQFNIAVHNSFGAPLSLSIDTLRARSFKDGSYTYLEFKNDTMNPFFIYAPTVDRQGEEVTTERYFNVQTSNIDELLASVPDQINFAFGASTGNPEGSTEQNFLLDDSKMTVETEVVLPMWLSMSGYTVVDTLDLAFDSLLMNLSFLEEALFRLTTTNEWPLEIAVQIYFLDAADTRMDSLFSDQKILLNAAPVDSEGELDRSALQEHVVDVELTAADLDELEGAKKMMLQVRAVTTDNGVPTVKFYSSYLLNYKLAIDADFNINSRELNLQ